MLMLYNTHQVTASRFIDELLLLIADHVTFSQSGV